MVIWLIGLSGAGKSAIGKELYLHMKAENPATVLVDGDEIRNVFKHDRRVVDYTIEGRRKNADRIREICAWLDRQGIDVVCCILSIFPESLKWNHKNYSRYFEVFVDAPFDDLVKRNPKNLYLLAMNGKIKNVVGVDIEFNPPISPDMIVHNERPFKKPDDIAQEIIKQIKTNRGI